MTLCEKMSARLIQVPRNSLVQRIFAASLNKYISNNHKFGCDHLRYQKKSPFLYRVSSCPAFPDEESPLDGGVHRFLRPPCVTLNASGSGQPMLCSAAFNCFSVAANFESMQSASIRRMIGAIRVSVPCFKTEIFNSKNLASPPDSMICQCSFLRFFRVQLAGAY